MAHPPPRGQAGPADGRERARRGDTPPQRPFQDPPHTAQSGLPRPQPGCHPGSSPGARLQGDSPRGHAGHAGTPGKRANPEGSPGSQPRGEHHEQGRAEASHGAKEPREGSALRDCPASPFLPLRALAGGALPHSPSSHTQQSPEQSGGRGRSITTYRQIRMKNEADSV